MRSPYHVTAALSATVARGLDNDNITNAGADFTVLKLDASVQTNARSKFAGDPDSQPELVGATAVHLAIGA